MGAQQRDRAIDVLRWGSSEAEVRMCHCVAPRALSSTCSSLCAVCWAERCGSPRRGAGAVRPPLRRRGGVGRGGRGVRRGLHPLRAAGYGHRYGEGTGQASPSGPGLHSRRAEVRCRTLQALICARCMRISRTAGGSSHALRAESCPSAPFKTSALRTPRWPPSQWVRMCVGCASTPRPPPVPSAARSTCSSCGTSPVRNQSRSSRSGMYVADAPCPFAPSAHRWYAPGGYAPGAARLARHASARVDHRPRLPSGKVHGVGHVHRSQAGDDSVLSLELPERIARLRSGFTTSRHPSVR
jgi:hypothetical protein